MASCARHSAMNASATMPKFVVDFGSLGQPPAADGRLDGPAFHRNHEAIWSAIAAFMRGRARRRAGGRQRHRAARGRFRAARAAADLVAERYSTLASRQHRSLAAAGGPCQFARAATHRPQRSRLGLGSGDAAAARSPPCSASTCCTFRPGACRKTSSPAPDACCAPGGRLFVYGPFMRDGAHTAPSNAAFDATLQGGKSGMGRARRRRSERAGAGRRLDARRNRADAGQ